MREKGRYSPLRFIKYFTWADLLLSLILLSSSLLFPFFFKRPGKGEEVVVETRGGDTYSLSLSKDTTLWVGGPLGKTEVKVERGSAFIAYSPCPQKICMKMGKIRRKGEMVVCVPNGVLVRITGRGELDGVTR